MENIDKNEISKEKLAQVALGNQAAIDPKAEETGPVAIPVTSGTGGNPSGARKDSLIINEELNGEDRYQAVSQDEH